MLFERWNKRRWAIVNHCPAGGHGYMLLWKAQLCGRILERRHFARATALLLRSTCQCDFATKHRGRLVLLQVASFCANKDPTASNTAQRNATATRRHTNLKEEHRSSACRKYLFVVDAEYVVACCHDVNSTYPGVGKRSVFLFPAAM